jgi:signal transduction histidine kinase
VIDPLGRVSPFTKTLEIEINKAFWQTTVFKGFVLAVLLFIGWLISKWYVSNKLRNQRLAFEKQQAIEKERTRIATDMHDDLGAGLSRIKFLSENMKLKRENGETIREDIEKISTYSDEMAEKMGEIVWALNEKNDTIGHLVAFTRSYVLEYLSGQNIQCSINTPLNLPSGFITGEMRQHIFLSVKECLHNIVKHAQASQVSFSVYLNGGIEIIIHDNGKGINWDLIRPFSNGLHNIKKRMSEINGDVQFKNENGTKVILSIPEIV